MGQSRQCWWSLLGWFFTHPVGSCSMGTRPAVGSLRGIPADFSWEQADQYQGLNASKSCGSAVTPFPIHCSNSQITSWWHRAAISQETPSLTPCWVGEHILLKSVYFQWANLMCGRLEKVKTFDFFPHKGHSGGTLQAGSTDSVKVSGSLGFGPWGPVLGC